MRACVFLDRDGVINTAAAGRRTYTHMSPSSCFHPLRGRSDPLFNALGLLVIVVTNQRGVAAG